ncbi:MAG: NlpC/P60 family protein [Pseudomonadota bacterium]
MSRDSRVTLARGDLAARALEGVVAADAYADSQVQVAIVPAVAIRRTPDLTGEQLDQLLFGEIFEVLGEQDGFAWGQSRRDGYVGFVERAALAPAGALPTHRVAAIRTYAFAEPSIKTRAFGPYSINALVRIEAREGRFAKAAGTGWFVEDHLAPIGRFEVDPVTVAERFLGAPYLWGGRESLGLDCSGLTQQALAACGIAYPRDTDQQERLGQPLAAADLRRGDLVFWKGHVAMMLDAERIIHANAHHMATAIEPLSQTRARYIAAGVGEPTAYRRP